MRSDTIQNYFLRAGASFRRSAEWAREFLDEKGQPRVIRAGRFGIGAFAVFLLGPSFKLWTRHADVDESMGYTIEASANSQLIEILRVGDLPVGTTIEVEVSTESAEALGLDDDEYTEYSGPGGDTDWFCWEWPKVVKRVVRGAKPVELDQQFASPVRRSKLPPEWSVIHPEGFDAVYWTFSEAPPLVCNGLKIADPREDSWDVGDAGFDWPNETQLRSPNIAVLDSAANLPLTTQRYKLSQDTVPFVDELARDVLLSFIAHALVCGPMSQTEALSMQRGHPLRPGIVSEYTGRLQTTPFANGLLRWCSTSVGMVPTDPWLYTLLNSGACLLYGTLAVDPPRSFGQLSALATLLERARATGHAILPWCGFIRDPGGNWEERANALRGFPERILDGLTREDVICLGPMTACHVLFSEDPELRFNPDMERQGRWFDGDLRPGSHPWREVRRHNSRRRCFDTQTGTLNPALTLEPFLEALETAVASNEVAFVAEIRTTRVESSASMIANIWKDLLGAKSIPFAATARKALIAEGSKHPDLKRHISAWKEMKRKRSKWVVEE